MGTNDQGPSSRRRSASFYLLLSMTALLAAGAAHAQPGGITMRPGRPFQKLDARVARVESELRAVRDLVGALEKMLTPLEGLERCVRVFEGELGGLPGPHILFTRCNVHVRSGELATDAPENGLGNLIVGYNEGRCVNLDAPGDAPPEDARFPTPCLSDRECGGGICDFGDRAGSHNLIVGRQHEYGSHGGIVGGRANALQAPEASITAGYFNRVEASFAAVHGGAANVAAGEAAAIASGRENRAEGPHSAVLGGELNSARGTSSAIVAGRYNETLGICSAVVAGGDVNLFGIPVGNRATGHFSAILAGQRNTTGRLTANDAFGDASSVTGGANNNASGETAVVVGGQANVARAQYSVVGGGVARAATGVDDWVAGDLFQDE